MVSKIFPLAIYLKKIFSKYIEYSTKHLPLNYRILGMIIILLWQTQHKDSDR